MAMSVARTMLRSARMVRPLMPRPSGMTGSFGFAPARTMAPLLCTRTFVSTNRYTREQTLDKLDNLYGEVLGANWADYLYLVYNTPFWEAELERVSAIVQPFLHEPEVGEKYKELQEMFDVLYQCEDVRDHLNELAELVTRASGLMGTGYAPGEKVDNMDENAQACGEAYDALLKKHPNFKPKIEQTLGHGLAILRSKHKFRFSSVYRYFY